MLLHFDQELDLRTHFYCRNLRIILTLVPYLLPSILHWNHVVAVCVDHNLLKSTSLVVILSGDSVIL